MTSSHVVGAKWGTTQTTFKSAFANTTKPTPKSIIPQQFKKPKPALLTKPTVPTGSDNKPTNTTTNSMVSHQGPTSTTNSTAKETAQDKSAQSQTAKEIDAAKESSLTKNNEVSLATTTPIIGGSNTQPAVGTTPNSGTTGTAQAPTSALGKMFNFVNYFKNDPPTSDKKVEINISKAGLAPRFDVDVVKSPMENSNKAQETKNNNEFQIKE